MKEINEEIKLTLDSMQKTDIDEGSHSELRYHLESLLERAAAALDWAFVV